jgi:nucleoside-diphosphate-sugar epimerase
LRPFLYTGSTSVYPDADGAWVDEACEAAPSTSLNEVLIETEGLLEEAVATGLFTSAGVMRLAGIYGPGRHHLLDTLREGVREIPGSGDYYLNLIHRDDAATALCLGLAAAVPGYSVWNLSDGSPATKEAIIEWSARRLGLPLPVFRPDLITPRMKRRQLFNGRPPNRRIDSRRVREELGWTPLYPDFRTGYEALV